MQETDVIETVAAENSETEAQTAPVDSAEITRLKAEIAKLNNKNNALATENASFKKQIRASKSAEEQRAEEEKERQEAIEQELKALRKQASVSTISKSVMGFLGDETISTAVAESLYGAEDVDAAIDAIQKAWTAREKKLRMEYGKIPAPDAGEGAPQVSASDLSKMSYRERLGFKQKYPDAYRKLMS